MLSSRVTVSNDLGLHARAAAQLVKGIADFRSKIILSRIDTEKSADARSILGVLTLAATHGTILEIVVEGADEADALAMTESLFANGFGEGRLLPK
jgi:phosphocarrier protein HPr